MATVACDVKSVCSLLDAVRHGRRSAVGWMGEALLCRRSLSAQGQRSLENCKSCTCEAQVTGHGHSVCGPCRACESKGQGRQKQKESEHATRVESWLIVSSWALGLSAVPCPLCTAVRTVRSTGYAGRVGKSAVACWADDSIEDRAARERGCLPFAHRHRPCEVGHVCAQTTKTNTNEKHVTSIHVETKHLIIINNK